MTKASSPSPDTTISSNDPGDETGRRYRYQWTYSAILACSLLDESQGISEIFCEHHEDSLAKHFDGMFTGIQVKTRAPNQPAWTSNDEQFKQSCARFIDLDTSYPNKFREFVFTTNHVFKQQKNTGTNIIFVLDEIHKSSNYDDILIKTVKKFINMISQTASTTPEIAFETLKKTHANAKLPKLEDIELRLISSLNNTWSKAKEYSQKKMIKAAKSLIGLCMEASTLSSEGALSTYISQTETDEDEIKRRIAGKKITKKILLDRLESNADSQLPLVGDHSLFEGFNAGSEDLLCKKLDAGGFSAVSRNSAINLRDKAEYLGIVWSKKEGELKGIEKYDHIQSIVLTDAASAFEETSTNDNFFGKEMLGSLRNKFRERIHENTILYDCSKEHLEGFAYSLTARCKVQWSIDTPWKNE